MAEDKKRGRPKKGFSPWDGWKGEILDLYAEGASDVEIKALIIKRTAGSLSKDLWHRWLEEEEDFSVTIQEGRLLCQVWWERLGRQYVVTDGMSESRRIQPAIYQIHMRNRFGWDKEHAQKPDNNINLRIIEVTSRDECQP